MRILRPVSFQMHRARAKAEPASGNAIGVGHHRKARQIERVVTRSRRCRAKYRPITPGEFTYGPAAARIQGKLRIPALKNQIACVDVHVEAARHRWLTLNRGPQGRGKTKPGHARYIALRQDP